jgi:hypothetical protein
VIRVHSGLVCPFVGSSRLSGVRSSSSGLLVAFVCRREFARDERGESKVGELRYRVTRALLAHRRVEYASERA